MTDYIRSMIVLSCFCSFIMPLLKHDSKLKKYAAFAVGLICVYSVISPLILMAGNISKIPLDIVTEDQSVNYDTADYCSRLVELTDIELRESLAAISKEKFNINVSSDKFYVSYDTKDYSRVKIVSVTLDLSDIIVMNNALELQAYISDLLMCKCEVVGV